MYFALKRYVTIQFIRYLDAIFKALKDGRLKAIDMEGTIIKPEVDVHIASFDKWNPRMLPAITVDVPSGGIQLGSIDKGFAGEERTNENPAKHFFVYPATISLDFTCYGRTIEERDRLVDLVAFFLTRFDIYDFFLTRKIRISEPISFSGFGDEIPPGQDFKIYYGTLTLGINSESIIIEERQVPTIMEIIAEVEDPVKI